jgi:hypothetical protein
MPCESLVVLNNEAVVLGGGKKIEALSIPPPMGGTLEPTEEEAGERLSRRERKHLWWDLCYAKSSGSRWAEGYHPVTPTGVTEDKEGYS